ncbi:MAG TPA: phosphomannomutase, partial [Methylothermaceae bacterium]|nr:phosphomannomutase [Methylothermaceae bacterium]
MSGQPSLRDILDHEPGPLRFGTSGVRGKVEELTDIEVYCLTRGTLAYFQQTGKLVCPGHQGDVAIPLAGDLRPSTARILQATAKGIVDTGFAVDYCGRIPTPALTYYALQRRVASFVVTGSHIPADRNGIKPNRCDGEVLKSDEAGIVAAVERFREQEYSRPAAESLFGADGMLRVQFQHPLPRVNPAAAKAYQDRYSRTFSSDA